MCLVCVGLLIDARLPSPLFQVPGASLRRLEFQTTAMPDVKTASCNYPSSAGPLAGCRLAMDLEPCLTDHPLPLPLAAPLPAYPGHSAAPYSALQGASPSPIPRCNSSALLSNLGLRYCSSSSGPPLRRADGLWPHTGLPPASCNSVGSRLYRSMENLNWNAMAEPSLFSLSTPYRSMDSEFIFRCTATSHWYDGPPEGRSEERRVGKEGRSRRTPYP